MKGGTDNEIDLEVLRTRLRKMDDQELRRFGLAVNFMCSLGANLGKPPRQTFIIQLEEARAEQERRKLEKGTQDMTAKDYLDPKGYWSCLIEGGLGAWIGGRKAGTHPSARVGLAKKNINRLRRCYNGSGNVQYTIRCSPVGQLQ
jgi:hypothetical protein